MDLKGKLQGLDWLIEEVEASLQQAAEALEAYVADPDDEAQIRFCLGYIHQVNGSLQIAECHGPLLLSEEVELLAVQLQNGEVNSISESCDVLIQAILRLPNYVRHVIATRNDQPEILLLLLNELRAVRGKPLVTEGAFFSPVLNGPVIGSSKPQQTPNPQALGNLLRKLRQMYQFAVLGIIKGENLNQNFSYADKVFSRLQELSQFSVQHPLWEVAKAFLENISGNNIPIGVAVKVLFRELDAHIKLLVQGGIAALNTKPPEALLKNLLFYVAYGGSKMPISSKVRKQYQLDHSLPDGVPEGHAYQYQPETLQNIVKELDRELDYVKKQIENYVLGDGLEVKLLEEANTVIQRMSDTLAVVGELPLRNKLKEIQVAIASEIDDGGDGNRSQMMAVATGLVEVEAGLFSWMDSNQLGSPRGQLVDERQVEVGRAQETLIREARNGLEAIKDSIVEFISSQWDRQRLEAIPPLVENVAAAMGMLALHRAQKILKNSNRYLVEQLLEGGVVPDWNSLDSLADAITSIDYYLELLGSQDVEGENTILDVAENSVAKLGYPVGDESAATADINTGDIKAAEIDVAESSPAVGTAEVEKTASEEAGTLVGDVPDYIITQNESPQQGVVDAEDEEAVDPEIIEIFIEEVGEVLEAVSGLLPTWAEDTDNHRPLADIRRSFHTLKGSGRMVAADHIGDLGWAVESLLNNVLDHQLPANVGTVYLVEQAVSEIPRMIEQFESSGDNQKTSRVIQLIDMADALACGEEIGVSAEYEPQEQQGVHGQIDEGVGVVAEQHDDEASEIPESDRETTAFAEEDGLLSESQGSDQKPYIVENIEEPLVEATPVGEQEGSQATADEELLDIFVEEAETQLQVVQAFIAEQTREAPVYSVPGGEVQSALHTLKGSALMAEVQNISELMVPLEQFVNELYQYQQKINADILSLLKDAVSATIVSLQQLRERRVDSMPELPIFLTKIKELRASSITPLLENKSQQGDGEAFADPAFLQGLMSSGMNKLLQAEPLLRAWQSSPDHLSPLFDLQQELLLLHEASERAEITSLAATCSLLCSVYDAISTQNIKPEPATVEDLLTIHDALLRMIDQVAASQVVDPLAEELSERVQSLLLEQPDTQEEQADGRDIVSDAGFLPSDLPESTGVESEDVTQLETPEIEPDSTEVDLGLGLDSSSIDLNDIDLDILLIFVTEAEDLLDESDQALSNWSENRQNSQHPEEIKRALHTLKGGARMSGLTGLGDLSHFYEDAIETLQVSKRVPDDNDFDGFDRQQGALAASLQEAKKLLSEQDSGFSAESAEQPDIQQSIEPEVATAPLSGQNEDRREVSVSPNRAQPAVLPDFGEASAPIIERKFIQQEMVKVAAPRLEELVNLAGETSIARGRVEQQVSEFSSALDEMDSTIQRLQDQVRRIGIETDAQMLFRREQIEASDMSEEFDPLEMDRYSQLQQLSRSLLESASDLHDLKTTLSNKTRDAETQLLEQSRINTDLQESMMRTRMVPFSKVVPRLRRMVRQLNDELDKHVNLKVANVDGEMDRSVMENILAPLEHMVRNSLDHGIESSVEREAAGKSPQGTITIDMAREGGDILIRLSDDGRGLNIDAIRQRAIAMGLVSETAVLEEQEIVQFIFHAGFSTSQNVSQVSGRGVGMDVVHSQVRQLGGVIETRTSAGNGTQFSIRLPFTVSVNRAMMIRIGEDYYALPLNTVDGVVRVSPAELEHYYRFPDSRLEYAGGRYQVRYLGSLLSENLLPVIDPAGESVFLVLVHSETRLYAVQVDELLSSDEIVVKSLGPQFSSVPGLSGATVRGDGSVVVILDLLALLRAKIAIGAGVEVLSSDEPLVASEIAYIPTVMVVDDSVTVRKVTGRLLEREGFRVLTANDGVAAMRLLQDEKPDVMLLDIEMPRMDGFEVASRVKGSSVWKDIPIIMITSRTGQKHRDRAFGLGVDKYLGKPFQEEILLQTIDEMLNALVES